MVTKKLHFMSLMTSDVFDKSKEESVKNTDSDNRFARPKNFKLDMTFEEHMKRIWKRNAVSMDKLSK